MGKRSNKLNGDIRDLKKKISEAKIKRNWIEAANLYNQLGNEYRLNKDFEEAIDAHQNEINICKKDLPKDLLALAVAYRNMGEVHLDMKDEKEAIRYVDLYMKTADKLGDLVEQQRASITFGRVYLQSAEDKDESDARRNEDLRKSLRYFQKAYGILRNDDLISRIVSGDNDREGKKEYALMKCTNCQNMAIVYNLLGGKDAEAKIWFTKAIEEAKKFNLHESLAPCYALLSSILSRDKDKKSLQEALEAAKNAVVSSSAIKDEVSEVEAILIQAKIYFRLDNLPAGKKLLQKVRKRLKKHTLHDFIDDVDTYLGAAVRIIKAKEEIDTGEDCDDYRKLMLYERMGDKYSVLENYERALNAYKHAAQVAVNVNEGGKKLARLYFSIAETFKDLERFSDAYKYYKMELRLHSGHPVEEFKTLSIIAEVLERLDKPQSEVIETLEDALKLSRQTGKPVKQVDALNRFSEYLRRIGRTEEAERYKADVTQIMADAGISLQDLDEVDPDSQEISATETDVDLDEQSSDSETEGDKRMSHWTNETGETKLHLAAKAGKVKDVRKWIKSGVPVNLKDFAGWTALHEACNFGHHEVVEILLEKGAKVNEAGGEIANKITPLHDAAQNGHFEVMKILIKYGANVVARDKNKQYPIEMFLTWRDSENFDESLIDSYREVKELLRSKMAEAGRPYTLEDEKTFRMRAKKRLGRLNTNQEEYILCASKPYDVDCPIPAKAVVDDYDPDQEGQGEEMYRNTMKGLRRKSHDNKKRRTKERSISPGPRGALIPEEKDFHQNHKDWLLPDDDTTPSTSRRHAPVSKRKRDCFEETTMRSRVTKRKTSERRRSSSPENDMEDSHQNASEDMDIDFGVDTFDATITEASNENDSQGIEDLIGIQNEDFSQIIEPDEDFLPSQAVPPTQIEFGWTKDNIPEKDYNVPSQRNNRRVSPKKSYINVSSEDEDESSFRGTPRQSMSELSNVLRQKQSNSFTSSNCNMKEKSLKQTRLPVKVISKERPNILSMKSRSPSPEIISSGRSRRISSSSASTVVEKKQEVLRLKVRIRDKLLLVPVESRFLNNDISWLAEECSKRYFSQYGVKPILSLKFEGAALSGSDSISIALDGNQKIELEGEVLNVNLPPITDRYSAACTEQGIEPRAEVTSALNSCQSSNILNLSDIPLRGISNIVLMNAVQMQESLTTMNLSGCCLFDSGIQQFSKALSTLKSLKDLDLSSNGITQIGFFTFVNVFSTDNIDELRATPTLTLTTLKLNHNPLGDRIGTELATLVAKLQNLHVLQLSDCDLSDSLMTNCRNELCDAFKNSRLEEVDISFNQFKDVGLERFLKILPARLIKTLDCSSCAPILPETPPNENVANAIRNFLSGNEDCCHLKTLKLNDCGLSDKSLATLSNEFDRLVRLESLELSCNKDLTGFSLVNILKKSVERRVPLSNLNLGSIPDLWKVDNLSDEQVLLAVSNKMASDTKLASLKVAASCSELSKSLDTSQAERLSDLEEKISAVFADYAGNATFRYVKEGSSIVFLLDE